MREEIARLRDATKAAIKRKSRKRQYIRVEETLIVSKVANLIAIKKSNYYNSGKKPTKRICRKRHCSVCSKIRHNARTYKVEIEDVEYSNASK